MDESEQSLIAPNSLALPLEVSVVSDAETTRCLSRVLALARLRSPYTWGFVLLLPLILMSRRFIEVFIAANSPGWNVSDLFVSYFGLLAVTVVMSLLLTGIQLIKRNASIAAYTAPGTAISARFQQDSLELILTTGTSTIPYGKIKDLITVGGGVLLRERGTRGLALPRGLFPAEALDLMGRRSKGRSTTPRDRRRRFIVAAVASLVVLGGAGVGAALLIRDGYADTLLGKSSEETARQAACDFVQLSHTYDYEHLDDFNDRVLDSSTGSVKSQWKSQIPVFNDVVISGQSVSRVDSIQCAAKSAGRSHAVIEVLLESIQRTPTSPPSFTSQQYLVTMVRKDGRWLCSEIGPARVG